MTRAEAVRVHERRLREAVRRLSGCLDALTPAQARVLRLRAALDQAATRSRHAVARRAGLRAADIVRLERRGLDRLRSAAGGGCGDPGFAFGGEGALGAGSGGDTPGVFAAAAGARDGAVAVAVAGGLLGESAGALLGADRADDGTGDVLGELSLYARDAEAGGAGLPAPFSGLRIDDPSDLPFVIVVAICALWLVFTVRREFRRS
jgi:hypothetical protein